LVLAWLISAVPVTSHGARDKIAMAATDDTEESHKRQGADREAGADYRRGGRVVKASSANNRRAMQPRDEPAYYYAPRTIGVHMNARSSFVLVAVLGLLVAAVPVAAHHSFAAEYDSNKPITVTGTVTKVEWTNPHARVYLDAKDETGKIVHWDFELGPPNGLMRRGWTRSSLKPGHVVTVAGFLSKTEPFIANARTVSLADGRQVFAGSSFDTGPTDGATVTATTPQP
jgi:hypothetical protein